MVYGIFEIFSKKTWSNYSLTPLVSLFGVIPSELSLKKKTGQYDCVWIFVGQTYSHQVEGPSIPNIWPLDCRRDEPHSSRKDSFPHRRLLEKSAFHGNHSFIRLRKCRPMILTCDCMTMNGYSPVIRVYPEHVALFYFIVFFLLSKKGSIVVHVCFVYLAVEKYLK